MIRRVVVNGGGTTAKNILYHVRGAVLISQGRRQKGVNPGVSNIQAYGAVYFDDAVRLQTSASTATLSYEFLLDVAENQPFSERIEEVSDSGCALMVFNQNGVLVCDNGITVSTSQAQPPATSGPGEMAGEPIDVPGEML